MACPTLRLLDRANVKRAAEKYNSELLAPLDSKIAKVVGTYVQAVITKEGYLWAQVLHRLRRLTVALFLFTHSCRPPLIYAGPYA